MNQDKGNSFLGTTKILGFKMNKNAFCDFRLIRSSFVARRIDQLGPTAVSLSSEMGSWLRWGVHYRKTTVETDIQTYML